MLVLASAVAFVLFLVSAPPANAEPSDADESSMDEILGGFDADDAADDSAVEEMDDILGGFDDEDGFDTSADTGTDDDSEADFENERIWSLQGERNTPREY